MTAGAGPRTETSRRVGLGGERLQVGPLEVARLAVPTPFVVGPVNVYVFLGEPLTLVDTGPRTAAARAALDQGLGELGLSRGDIERVILTHGHVDHLGLAAEIAAARRLPVHIHPEDAWRLTDHGRVIGLLENFARRLAADHGIPEALCASMIAGIRAFQPLAEPIDASLVVPLESGDVWTCGGQSFEVIHTPGHSPGSVCFYHRASRTLVSGDTVLPTITPNPLKEPYGRPGVPGAAGDEIDRVAAGPGSLERFVASIARLRTIEVVRALPGHGAPFDRVDRVLDRYERHRERRSNRLLRLLAEEPLRAYDVARRLWTGLLDTSVYLALSEVLGHLELLARQGRVQPFRDRAGCVAWRLVGTGGAS